MQDGKAGVLHPQEVWGKVRAWQRVAISGLLELSYGNVCFWNERNKN
jgi:hypothetical protein